MVSFEGRRGNRARVVEIANKNGVSIKVAEQIIKAYCNDLEESLLNGVSVNVPGVFSIKVTDSGVFRGRVSASLSAKAQERAYTGYKVSSHDG